MYWLSKQLFFLFILIISDNLFSQELTQIQYELKNVVKRKIKNGVIIEEKNEPMEFLGIHNQYIITGLNTQSPVLHKYYDSSLIEKAPLVLLNKTKQGNYYLAQISAVGNVCLITIMPNQRTVAVAFQFWLSFEDVVILWQGFGNYK